MAPLVNVRNVELHGKEGLLCHAAASGLSRTATAEGSLGKIPSLTCYFFLCVYVCVSEDPEKPLVPLSSVEEKKHKEELLYKNHWPKQPTDCFPFSHTHDTRLAPPPKKKSL